MLLEMLVGGVVGAAAGAVCANLRPRARRRGNSGESMTEMRRSLKYFCKDFFPKTGNFPPLPRVQGDENNASGPLAAGKNGRVWI